MCRTLEHPWLESVALCFLGAAWHDRGDLDVAYKLFSEAMDLCGKAEDPYLTLLISTVFTRTAQALGRLTEVQRLLDENLRIARESGNRWGIGLGLEQLAANAQAMGDQAGARRMLQESIDIYREVGDPWSLSRALNLLSRLALTQSDLEGAEAAAADAFRTARAAEYNLNALEALAALAEVHAGRGRILPAFELASFVLGHSASSQDAKSRAEALRAELEMQLTSDQRAAARSRVQSMTLDTLAAEPS